MTATQTITTHDITITGTTPTNNPQYIQQTYKRLATAGKLTETTHHNTYYDHNNNPPNTTIYATLEIKAPNQTTAHRIALGAASTANLQNPQTNNRTQTTQTNNITQNGIKQPQHTNTQNPSKHTTNHHTTNTNTRSSQHNTNTSNK